MRRKRGILQNGVLVDPARAVATVPPGPAGFLTESVTKPGIARLGFLADCDDDERTLIADQASHREHRLFKTMKAEAEHWGRSRSEAGPTAIQAPSG